MALTSIGDQKTPGRPIEITFGAALGLPSANQTVLLIGHEASTGGTAAPYSVTTINNATDAVAAKAEAETKFGAGSQLAKMVVAAVNANALAGRSNFPQLKAVGLAFADTDFGASDAALTAAAKVEAEFVVSPYDATNATLLGKLKDTATLMSGAQRVENNQYGTEGVAFNFSTVDPSTLPKPDSQFLFLNYLRDTGSNPYSVAEAAAACAAAAGSLVVPFNPLDNVLVGGITAPALHADYLSIGAGLESESALNQGWTPLKVQANGDVAFVRTVTARVTTDGVVAATAYYDLQDFMVLYFWRKTVFARLNQPDLKQVKASAQTAKNIKSEIIRLAKEFEDQNMFQAVDKLAPQFLIERSASDRHRFDFQTPVNVIPGLHVVAGNVIASTQFDTFSV